jgi:hypothetical protein
MNGNTFVTRRLHFASYLHASGLLPFVGVERESPGGRAMFEFEDLFNAGPELELSFDNGAATSANKLFSSLTYLRRQMDGNYFELGASNRHVYSNSRNR